jgi:ubiquinone/menaquinone biosynthesis C-methylase UbiE
MALKRRARRIVEELDPKDGDKILDVGCGDGFYLHLLSNLGIKLNLTGCDFDFGALRSAKKNLRGKKVRLIQADLMKRLPFRDESFDKIVMSEVAEHLPNDVRGLKEVYRVLKTGGILCLSVPNANYPFLWDPVNWVLEHFFGTHIKSGFWAGIWNQHLRLYTPLQIKKVVKKAGFKVKKVESLTWWCLPFNHNLLHFAARKLYGNGFSEDIAKAVSKYKTQKSKNPLFIEIAFRVVNWIDKLNDVWQVKGGGVGVFVIGEK